MNWNAALYQWIIIFYISYFKSFIAIIQHLKEVLNKFVVIKACIFLLSEYIEKNSTFSIKHWVSE